MASCLKEASLLLKRAEEALSVIDPPHEHSAQFSERPVVMRHQALRGVLIMAINDLRRVVQAWEEWESYGGT